MAVAGKSEVQPHLFVVSPRHSLYFQAYPNLASFDTFLLLYGGFRPDRTSRGEGGLLEKGQVRTRGGGGGQKNRKFKGGKTPPIIFASNDIVVRSVPIRKNIIVSFEPYFFIAHNTNIEKHKTYMMSVNDSKLTYICRQQKMILV